MHKDKGGLSIKSIRDMNDALLLKNAWDCYTGINVHWCQALKCKYDQHLNKNKSCISHLGRLINSLLPNIQENSSRHVINEDDTLFKLDKWISPNDGLINHTSHQVQENLLDLKVASIMKVNDKWDVDFLQSYLPQQIINKILTTQTPRKMENKDLWL